MSSQQKMLTGSIVSVRIPGAYMSCSLLIFSVSLLPLLAQSQTEPYHVELKFCCPDCTSSKTMKYEHEITRVYIECE